MLRNWLRLGVGLAVVSVAMAALGQESTLHAELRREGERAAEACKFSFKSIGGCGYTLFTDHPLHIAAGSMPPQNGFGVGGAFVWSKNTRNWRMSWDMDAVGAFSGAWRAGGYMKLVHTPHPKVNPIHVVVPGTSSSGGGSTNFTHPYTVFNFYAQTISLNKIFYFGLGNDTTLASKSLFGMKETIIGANVIKPVYEIGAIRRLNLSLLGEMNGRFVNIRGEHGQSDPSIETFYTDATAPGLSNQPGYFQLGEGVRVKPAIGNLQLNYMTKLQQFFAPSNSQNSFMRWTVDLDHTYSLYGHTQLGNANDAQGPDDCAPMGETCPKTSYTRNLNGSIEVQLLLTESFTSGSSVVPFYFQPTLGGSDIDSTMMLGSYQDYRFRAPNFLLLREAFEHSIWGPFGLKFMADEGRVALTRGDVGFSDMKHSFAAGFTLRAGAFPMVSLMFAWGGPEGHHNILNMNTSLLGGSARPMLE